jgi:hypothetical protein
MAEPLNAKKVYKSLRQYLRRRPDMGVAKGLLDCVLEPSSPFDSKSRRLPKRWFVLLVLLAVYAFSCFVYFNGVW